MSAESTGHIERLRRRGQGADDRPVLVPPAADAADHGAVHQIEHGKNMHVLRLRSAFLGLSYYSGIAVAIYG
jgi:hypothetical protein